MLAYLGMGSGLRLSRPRTNHDQAHTGDQRDCAEDRRDGQSVLGLMGDLERPGVYDFLLVGEGDSSRGESDDAEEDQKYSYNRGCLHAEPFVRVR
jgi:hypothetical protein